MTTTGTNPEIAALDRECYPDNPLTPEQWWKVWNRADCGVSTAVEGERVRGFVVYQMVREGGSPCAKIKRLGVGVQDRGRGYGKGLLADLADVHCEATVREDNLPGLKLLTSSGFQVLGLERGRFGDRDGVTLWRAGK